MLPSIRCEGRRGPVLVSSSRIRLDLREGICSGATKLDLREGRGSAKLDFRDGLGEARESSCLE